MMSFRLSDAFVATYADRPVDWGFSDVAGNSLGEITFLRTYSRIKEDGTKERWHEVCRRVIEGMYSIQKAHVLANRLPWSATKAARSAEDAFARLFAFKWTPPGRGLWIMGTPLVMEQHNSAALQNCAFVSTGDMTRNDPAAPFTFLMEASMLGIGVGFDLKGADKGFEVFAPTGDDLVVSVIPDTREGWVDAVRVVLEAYLRPGRALPVFDYSEIRPAGAIIRTFGGTAAGPAPLRRLVVKLAEILGKRVGERLSSTDILDIGNLIGVCVVSGNVRRSAELAIGTLDDAAFLDAKAYSWDAESGAYTGPAADRAEWGWMSNNSVAVSVGDDLSPIIESIQRNGEPGIVWMDLARSHGRLADPANNRDHRASGFNPCAEQTLESFECCTLVETYLGRADDLDDYRKTLKVAYLYAKTVTLLPTHWPRTNAIMQRNRRIGTSMSGIANFADAFGTPALRGIMDAGYATVGHYDRVYSEWLCVRESLKMTTVKPSGTVSILAGESPGVHWSPGGKHFERRIRCSRTDPMLVLFRASGYSVEPASEDPRDTVVVTFPIRSKAKRSEQDVSIFEKASLAALAQRHWSDNSVSVTLSFDPATEAQHVESVLKMHEGELKSVSFLPMGNGSYTQMPYTEITSAAFEEYGDHLFPVDLTAIYEGLGVAAVGESYCTTDSCEVKSLTAS